MAVVLFLQPEPLENFLRILFDLIWGVSSGGDGEGLERDENTLMPEAPWGFMLSC